MKFSCTHAARPPSIDRSSRRFWASSRNLRASSTVGWAAFLGAAFFCGAADAGAAARDSRSPTARSTAGRRNERDGFFMDSSANRVVGRGGVYWNGSSRSCSRRWLSMPSAAMPDIVPLPEAIVQQAVGQLPWGHCQRHDLRLSYLAIPGHQRHLMDDADGRDDLVGGIAAEVEAVDTQADLERERPGVDLRQGAHHLR